MLALYRYCASYSMLATFGRIVNTAFTVFGRVGENHMLIPLNLYGGKVIYPVVNRLPKYSAS